MFSKISRGNVTIGMLVGWGLTLAVATVGGIIASINHSDSKIDSVQSNVSEDRVTIATLSAESQQYRRDISGINAKLDKLLWANDINPMKIISIEP